MIVEYLVMGFLSAIGWWGANHYVIEPHFPPPVERKEEKKPVVEQPITTEQPKN